MTKPLCAIMPVYNEAATVGTILERVLQQACVGQVIIVDDASDDATPSILQQWQSQPGIVLIRHARNQGKGAAIRSALPHVTCPYVIIQDADLEYDPSDYAAILAALTDGDHRVCYGSRLLQTGERARPGGLVPRWGVSLLNFSARLLYGCRLTDLATCYKAFPTEILREMELEYSGFEFCAEVTAKTCRLGYAICELPIRYSPRSRAEGKKIRVRHGLSMLAALWKLRHWTPVARGTRHAARGISRTGCR